MATQPLSVTIITLNEEKRLAKCLASVDFADEIVVIDSGSTDQTTALAQQLGAKVISQPWLGYGPQKHFAVQQARYDWVLCLDADEQISPALAQQIQQVLNHPQHRAYQSPRINFFMGRWLHHGEGYPDWSLRLFHRQYARWSEEPVHEAVMTDEKVGQLSGHLLHESQDTLTHYLEKQNRYTSLQAEHMHQAGQLPSTLKMLLSPVVRFIKFYVLRRGFLDGVPGLVHTLIGCYNSFSKMAKLIDLTQRAERSNAPLSS
ncbi:MAG TPA: glycosyltransferase family 2 protein [Flavobacteriales bacterium]|nr:glycosyltransferase family 2 protein [Flavobacteriales bacterium]